MVSRRRTSVTPSVSEGPGRAGGAPPTPPGPSLTLGVTERREYRAPLSIPATASNLSGFRGATTTNAPSGSTSGSSASSSPSIVEPSTTIGRPAARASRSNSSGRSSGPQTNFTLPPHSPAPAARRAQQQAASHSARSPSPSPRRRAGGDG